MTATAASSRTPLPLSGGAPRKDADIDYELFLDCVHCGLCTSSCPTYVELGDENDSPRGRIYLMRAVTDGRLELTPEVQVHLDRCLDCRACESACPSGVQYGKLIEPFRIHQAQTAPPQDQLNFLTRLLLFQITPSARRTRLALAPARLLQRTGMDRLLEKTGLLSLLPRFVRQLHDMLPPLDRHYGKLPEVLPPEGKRRARVALFIGCAGDAFFPQTNLATARVLQHNGCEVWVPRGQVCCGALHYHAAQPEPAKEFARRNCGTFLTDAGKVAEQVDAIITNAAGCGAMLKDYGHLLHDTPEVAAATDFSRKVRDIHEFLMELGPVAPRHPMPLRATYHDACHLCHGQQIRQPPRDLLGLIPGLQLVPLAETELCCGAAGSYNLTQPEMAERLGRRKARNILDTNVDAVFAANVGCLLQIGRYLRAERPDMWVTHPMDILWASYSGENPGKSGKNRPDTVQ
jgi:glycolate oxidase iron-sulfur subunit